MKLLSDYIGAIPLGSNGATVLDVDVSPDGKSVVGLSTERGYLKIEDVLDGELLEVKPGASFAPSRPVVCPLKAALTDEKGRVVGRIADAVVSKGKIKSYLVERPFRTAGKTFEIGEETVSYRRCPKEESVVATENAATPLPSPLRPTVIPVSVRKEEPVPPSPSVEPARTEACPERDYFSRGTPLSAEINFENSDKISEGVSKEPARTEAHSEGYVDRKALHPVELSESRLSGADKPEQPEITSRGLSDTRETANNETPSLRVVPIAQTSPDFLSSEHRANSEKAPHDAPDCLPERIISDFSFLLGRIVTSDVLAADGTPIIRQGELILARTVAIARRHFKLFELTVKSRN